MNNFSVMPPFVGFIVLVIIAMIFLWAIDIYLEFLDYVKSSNRWVAKSRSPWERYRRPGWTTKQTEEWMLRKLASDNAEVDRLINVAFVYGLPGKRTWAEAEKAKGLGSIFRQMFTNPMIYNAAMATFDINPEQARGRTLRLNRKWIELSPECNVEILFNPAMVRAFLKYLDDGQDCLTVAVEAAKRHHGPYQIGKGERGSK